MEFRSRAAFKLAQMDSKLGLLRPGMRCLDCGASPGGWSQVASRKIGHSGSLIAVDLLPMEPVESVVFIQGDIQSLATWNSVSKILEGKGLDLILSDMSPPISGNL